MPKIVNLGLSRSILIPYNCYVLFLNPHHSFTSRCHLSQFKKGFRQHATQWTSCETGYLVSEETCGNGFSPTFPVDLNMLVLVNQRRQLIVSRRGVFRKCTSNSLPVLSGVPQGNILRLILFFIFVNGISASFNHSSIIMSLCN